MTLLSQVYRPAAVSSELSEPCCMASKFMGPLSNDVIAVNIEKKIRHMLLGFSGISVEIP